MFLRPKFIKRLKITLHTKNIKKYKKNFCNKNREESKSLHAAQTAGGIEPGVQQVVNGLEPIKNAIYNLTPEYIGPKYLINNNNGHQEKK